MTKKENIDQTTLEDIKAMEPNDNDFDIENYSNLVHTHNDEPVKHNNHTNLKMITPEEIKSEWDKLHKPEKGKRVDGLPSTYEEFYKLMMMSQEKTKEIMKKTP